MVFDRTPSLFVAVDDGKRYRFYIGRPICCKCGTKGHLASACTTQYCRSCKRMGHATGDCHLACPTCYKDHSRPNSCTLKSACRGCRLWGHTVADCPSELCTKCNAYGHRNRDCASRHQAVLAASADAATSTDQQAKAPGNAAEPASRAPFQLSDFIPAASTSAKSPLHARIDSSKRVPAAASGEAAARPAASSPPEPLRCNDALAPLPQPSASRAAAPPPAAAAVWHPCTKSFAAVAATAAAATAAAAAAAAGAAAPNSHSSPPTPAAAPTPPSAPATPRKDDHTGGSSTLDAAGTRRWASPTAAPATATAAAAPGGSGVRAAHLLQALEAASLFDYAVSLRVRSKAAAAKLRALCSLAAADLAMVLNQPQPEDLLDMMADRQQQQQGACDEQQDVWPQQQELRVHVATPAHYTSPAAPAAHDEARPSHSTTNAVGGSRAPAASGVPAHGLSAALQCAQQRACSTSEGAWWSPAVIDPAAMGGAGIGMYGHMAAAPAAAAAGGGDDDDDLASMLSLLGVVA
ncbi:hypothetical protein COO60DRAFT_914423 [Scenedesmus sp. NREL 46B-D3]|nr:hypothetical protein COO60DRAFT_914423 [Scenedesmus sp. NREL 46B-D3]